jgi:hypothetical protein
LRHVSKPRSRPDPPHPLSTSTRVSGSYYLGNPAETIFFRGVRRCREKKSKYVCPRCNVFYCSLDCFRSPVSSHPVSPVGIRPGTILLTSDHPHSHPPRLVSSHPVLLMFRLILSAPCPMFRTVLRRFDPRIHRSKPFQLGRREEEHVQDPRTVRARRGRSRRSC